MQKFKVADGGGGPPGSAAKVNGKDQGGLVELTWIRDDRPMDSTSIRDKAGLFDSLLVARSNSGNNGTAGVWMSAREIRGLITQTPLPITTETAMGVSNVTFFNFTGTLTSQVGNFRQYEALQHISNKKRFFLQSLERRRCVVCVRAAKALG